MFSNEMSAGPWCPVERPASSDGGGEVVYDIFSKTPNETGEYRPLATIINTEPECEWQQHCANTAVITAAPMLLNFLLSLVTEHEQGEHRTDEEKLRALDLLEHRAKELVAKLENYNPDSGNYFE